ncbi:unnamed protein product [Darwinula stevensoni]|uniref:Uncharacterized protein n=1 Tax=Darwinula stevensoni TaxID=69355 RepID=A0A7R8X825_9CRUS|nr:unnamed protein product [Darwinula stevensoni]CAG0888375.1 unnamed protein product [Darwinula stevensoni]
MVANEHRKRVEETLNDERKKTQQEKTNYENHLNEERIKLNKEKESAADRLAAFQLEHKKLMEKYSALNSEMEELSRNNLELMQEKNQLQEAKEEVQNQLDLKTQEVKLLKVSITDLQGSLASLKQLQQQQDTTDLQAKNQALQQKVHLLQDQLKQCLAGKSTSKAAQPGNVGEKVPIAAPHSSSSPSVNKLPEPQHFQEEEPKGVLQPPMEDDKQEEQHVEQGHPIHAPRHFNSRDREKKDAFAAAQQRVENQGVLAPPPDESQGRGSMKSSTTKKSNVPNLFPYSQGNKIPLHPKQGDRKFHPGAGIRSDDFNLGRVWRNPVNGVQFPAFQHGSENEIQDDHAGGGYMNRNQLPVPGPGEQLQWKLIQPAHPQAAQHPAYLQSRQLALPRHRAPEAGQQFADFENEDDGRNDKYDDAFADDNMDEGDDAADGQILNIPRIPQHPLVGISFSPYNALALICPAIGNSKLKPRLRLPEKGARLLKRNLDSSVGVILPTSSTCANEIMLPPTIL